MSHLWPCQTVFCYDAFQIEIEIEPECSELVECEEVEGGGVSFLKDIKWCYYHSKSPHCP